jgi:hypothetical protein
MGVDLLLEGFYFRCNAFDLRPRHNVAACVHCPVGLDSIDGVVAEMATMTISVPRFTSGPDSSDQDKPSLGVSDWKTNTVTGGYFVAFDA